MHFETLDQGASRGQGRYRCSTRAYLYALIGPSGQEVLAAHWHPTGKSPVSEPHWHLGSPALSTEGVFLARAHIPSPRISFEHLIRWTLENVKVVEPACVDWRERLARTEQTFEQFKSW